MISKKGRVLILERCFLLLVSFFICITSNKLRVLDVVQIDKSSIMFDIPVDKTIHWTIGDKAVFTLPSAKGGTVDVIGEVTFVKSFEAENIFIYGTIPSHNEISVVPGTFSASFYKGTMSANVEYLDNFQFELRYSSIQRSDMGLTKTYVMTKVNMTEKYYSKEAEQAHAMKRLAQSRFRSENAELDQLISTSTKISTQNIGLRTTPALKILMLYTKEAVAAAGGETNILAQISLAIGNYNVALQNSLVDMTVSYVAERIQEYDTYVEDSGADPFGTILGQMGSTISTTRRNLLRCHAVHLVISKTQYCGLGWYHPSGLTNGNSVGCYVCIGGYMTTAHEVGHNLGLEHDLVLSPGIAQNHGYCWDDTNSASCHRSVMAYGSCVTPLGRTNCARVKYFSNPYVSEAGNPVGTVSQCNNAQQLRDNINNFLNQFTPSFVPESTIIPTYNPSSTPSLASTTLATLEPTMFPTILPSYNPSFRTSIVPSMTPTLMSSKTPTIPPTLYPSFIPSIVPSFKPISESTIVPSIPPTFNPSDQPHIIYVGSSSFPPSSIPSQTNSTDQQLQSIQSNFSSRKMTLSLIVSFTTFFLIILLCLILFCKRNRIIKTIKPETSGDKAAMDNCHNSAGNTIDIVMSIKNPQRKT